MFHRHCLRSWLLAGNRSCPCDREGLDLAFVAEIQGLTDASRQVVPDASTLARDIDVNKIFNVHESGDVGGFLTSVHHLIGFLENAENDLCARPRSLQITLRAAFENLLGPWSAHLLQPQSQDPAEQHERLKAVFADILHACMDFLRHPYFRSYPAEHNRMGLMIAILRKRRDLHRWRQLAVSAADRLHQADFFASLSSQQRHGLHVANDGLIWYILKRVIADQLPPGSSQLELSLQRSCLLLLDEMYAMWRITDLRN